MNKIARLLVSLNRPRIDSALYGWGDNASYGLTNVLPTDKTETPTSIDVVSNWSKLAAGADFAVGIKQDGSLWTWGNNTWGQLGRSDAEPYVPKRVTDFTWTDVSAGDHFVHAIRSDGKLFAWGRNSQFVLGYGGSDMHASSPVQVGTSIAGSWTQVSCGKSHVAVVLSGTTLYTWGVGTDGQLGNGERSVYSVPQLVSNNVVKVAAGHYHTVALASNGALLACGNSSFGQLGQINEYQNTAVMSVVNYANGVVDSDWSDIAAGAYHTVATRSSNKSLWTWGRNTEGQLGVSTIQHTSSPVQVSSSAWSEIFASENTTAAIRESDSALFMWGTNKNTIAHASSVTSWSQISVGDNITAAIKTDGTLWVWGSSAEGLIGDSSSNDKSSPVQIGTGLWSQVSVGKHHVAAIKNDGSLWGWGNNTYGQLGTLVTTGTSSPVQVGTLSWTSVSAGGEHTVAVNTDGVVYSWGRNDNGQLGDVTTSHRSSPVQLTAAASWSNISAGEDYTIAINTNGTLWGWGNGYDGQVGSLPVAVGAEWKSISGIRSGDHGAVHGIKSDGTMWTWGKMSNTSHTYMYGIGDGANTIQNAPVQIAGSWSQVVSGDKHVLAIKSDGSLWGWGNNTLGQVGVGSNTSITNTPTLIDAGSWIQISTGENHSLALKSDHSVWGWGSTTDGRLLGIEQLPATWASISAGRAHTLALTTDGRLYAWGNNDVGQLGTNDTNTVAIPHIVKAGSWLSIITSGNSSYAIKSDNTLYVWGENSNGQLGTSDVISRSSPTQIAGSWTSVTSAAKWAAGVKTDGTAHVWGQFGAAGVYTSSPVQISSQGGSSTGWLTAASINDALYLTSNTGKVSGIGSIYRWFDTRTWRSISTPHRTENKVGIIAGIDENYKLWTWGYNESGALGQGTTQSPSIVGTNNDTWVSVPAQIGTDSWVFVSSRGNEVMAKRSDGSLWQWGKTIESSATPFEPTYATRSSPVQVSGSLALNFANVSFAGDTRYGIANTGIVYNWGWWSDWVYYNGATTRGHTPSVSALYSNSTWNHISTTNSYSLAIKTDGTLWVTGVDVKTTGSNTVYGATGRIPVEGIASLSEARGKSWSQIAYDYDHALAIATDGTLWAWGQNANGQLGLNHRNPRYMTPEKVGSDSWISIATAGPTSFAIKADGTLWGWGSDYGYDANSGLEWSKLGLGNTVSGAAYSSPIQIGTSNTWVKITAAANNTTGKSRVTGIQRVGGAIDANSVAYAWGWYAGNTTFSTNAASSPAYITNYVWDVSTNYGHTICVTTTSNYPSVRVWGYENGYGKTAGTTVGPVAIRGITWVGWNLYGPKSCAAGSEHSVVMGSSGKTLTWGYNADGRLGLGDKLDRSSPANVDSFSDVTAVSAGGNWTAWQRGTNNIISFAGWSPAFDSLITARSNPLQIGSGYVLPTSTPANTRILLTQSNTTSTYGKLMTFGVGFAGEQAAGFVLNYTNTFYTNTNPSFGTALYGQLRQIPGSWVHAHAGPDSAWAVSANGTLWAWGKNDSDNPLGNATGVSTSSPVQIGTANNWARIDGYVNKQAYSTSNSIILTAFTTSNNLYYWGAINQSVPQYNTPQLAVMPNGNNYVASGAGYFTGYSDIGGLLTVGSTGTLNFNGGNYLRTPYQDYGSTTMTEVNEWPKPLSNVSYAAAALTLSGNTSWISVSGGRSHAVAIQSNGTHGKMWAWGRNNLGQLGTMNVASNTMSLSPRQVGAGVSWFQARAGADITLAIQADSNTSNYSLYGWGYERQGILGTGNGLSNISSPVQLGTGAYTYAWAYRNDTDNLADSMVSYAIKANSLSATGNGFFGDNTTNTEFQTSNTFTTVVPVTLAVVNSPVVLLDSSWSVISAGSKHNMAIKSDGTLYAWGSNEYGQLGDGTRVSRSSPVQLGSSANWTGISAGYDTTAGINGGSLYAWGLNTQYQIGDNTVASRSSPVNIGSTMSWSVVSAGNRNITARTTGSNVYITGITQDGTYSTPTLYQQSFAADHLYPVYHTNYSGVTANTVGVMAISQSNGLFAKGYAHLPVGLTGDRKLREFVQLDGGYPTSTSSPVQIGTFSWSSVSAGFHHNIGIRTNGTIWSWGLNWDGQLGINGVNNASAPTQIGSNAAWTAADAGNANTSMARKSDDALWAWGYNSTSYILGNETTTSKSSPVQVGANTTWSNNLGGISITGGAAIANGALYYWGNNEKGQAGRDDVINPVSSPTLVPILNTSSTSSPVQIGTESWRTIGTRTSFVVGVKAVE